MKSFMRLIGYSCLIVFVFTLLSCSQRYLRSPGDASEKVGEAQVYFDDANKLKDKFLNELIEAKRRLDEAREELQKGKKSNPDKAYESASESLALSREILKKDFISKGKVVEEVIKEIESKPIESSYRSLLPKLQAIVKYANDLEMGQQVTISGYRTGSIDYEMAVPAYINRVEKVIESKISFKSGKYKINDLLNSAKHEIDVIVQDIKNSYSNTPFIKKTIIIDTYGYTDEMDFKDRTLIKELETGPTEVPATPSDKRRKALNMNLSYFRAETIGEYLKQRFESEDISLNLIIKSVGKGETLPEGKNAPSSPYPNDDPRRRICIIESFVEAFEGNQ